MDPDTFLTELKRRKVYRVKVAYAIAAHLHPESVLTFDTTLRSFFGEGFCDLSVLDDCCDRHFVEITRLG